MILTDAERARFIEWLDTEATTNDVLAKQADKLGLAGGQMAKRLRVVGMSCKIVSEVLKHTESQTIGGRDDVGPTPPGTDGS